MEGQQHREEVEEVGLCLYCLQEVAGASIRLMIQNCDLSLVEDAVVAAPEEAVHEREILSPCPHVFLLQLTTSPLVRGAQTVRTEIIVFIKLKCPETATAACVQQF